MMFLAFCKLYISNYSLNYRVFAYYPNILALQAHS